jgi:hypothetical protein
MPEGRVWRRRVTAAGLALGATLLFAALATLDAGGYQYGVSDQAFYIPAILHHLDPRLFPRDWPMLAAQDRFSLFAMSAALEAGVLGLSLPLLFALGYLTGLVVLFWALVAIGRSLYRSWWTVAVLATAMTLRHRVVQTGVNTLESYMHPRMLAFAVGAAAVAALLRGRSWLAIGLAGCAGLMHPTIGGWFCVWIGVAVMVSDRRARAPLACITAALGAVAVTWMAWHGLPIAVTARMDADWWSVLRTRDYLFPFAWHGWAWALMLAYPVLIGVIFRLRLKAGVALPQERGLVAGSLVLFLVLLAALPLIALRFAFAVQLQVPRVLWMMELLLTLYVAWWIVERPRPASGEPQLLRRHLAIATVVVVLAIARGGYVAFVEHAGRPVVRIDLAADDWRDAMAWLEKTPVTAHVLADPGHAWKYGSSVRVAAARDVFQEEGKDAAFALYSRETAMRVLTRIGALGDFQRLTANRARELAAAYDIDYLVAEQSLDLPVAYRNRRFTIYAVKEQ